MADNKDIIDVEEKLEEQQEIDNRSLLVRVIDKTIAILVIGGIFVLGVLGIDKLMEWVRATIWNV